MATWGVIFDWDGIIVDSRAQHEASWRRLADEERQPLPAGHFLRGFGMKNEYIIPQLLKWTEDPADVRRLSLRKETLYREIVQETGLKALPGVESLLRTLRDASIPCAVGSSTPRVNIDFVLERLGFRNAFDAVIAAEDVTRGKPDPEVFVKAAQALGQPAGRCVVFEDTLVGIEAARAGGMKVVAVTTTNPPERLVGADLIVERLSEVSVDLLARWFSGA